jgi:molybdopterin synthase sulfur carrier subunit
LALLKARGEPWSSALAEPGRILIAVNQEMAGADTCLKDMDELAFFPPVTGG